MLMKSGFHQALILLSQTPHRKNPENILYFKDWQQLLGDRWILVQVVRNPLDTLASIKEMRFPLTIPTNSMRALVCICGISRQVWILVQHIPIVTIA